MAHSQIHDIARARLAETFGGDHAEGDVAADLVEAVADSLERGCLVIQDSRS